MLGIRIPGGLGPGILVSSGSFGISHSSLSASQSNWNSISIYSKSAVSDNPDFMDARLYGPMRDAMHCKMANFETGKRVREF
jgi:hypothetical protein